MQFTEKEQTIINTTASDCNFAPEDFLDCNAGIYRLCTLSQAGSFDREFNEPEEMEAFRVKLAAMRVEPKLVFDGRGTIGIEAAYFIFPDDSLYFCSNAEDEVWLFGDDFAHQLDDAEPGNLSEIDLQLLSEYASPNNGFGDLIEAAKALRS